MGWQTGCGCCEIGDFYSSNILYVGEGKFALYIDKETGLAVKNQNGAVVDANGVKTPIIMDYEYKFDVVTDEELVEPDISEYEIQQ